MPASETTQLATLWPAKVSTRPFIYGVDDYALPFLQIGMKLRVSETIMDKIRRKSLVENRKRERCERMACTHCFIATQWPAKARMRPFIHVDDHDTLPMEFGDDNG